MRKLDELSFNTRVATDIERLQLQSMNIRPENFNTVEWSYIAPSVDAVNDVNWSMESMVNSVDTSKIKNIIAYLKSNKIKYLDSVYTINNFDIALGQQSTNVFDESAKTTLATSSVFFFKAPENWSFIRAVVYPVVSETAIETPNYTLDSFVKAITLMSSSSRTNTAGIQIYLTEREMKVEIEHQSIHYPYTFPGMTIYVKFFKGAI